MNSFQVAVWAVEEYVKRIEANKNVTSLSMLCAVMADTHGVSSQHVYQDAVALIGARTEWQQAIAANRESQKSSTPNVDNPIGNKA